MEAPQNGTEQIKTGLSVLPADEYRRVLKELIRKHLKSSADECDINIEAASAKGDNYVGVLYRVTAEQASGEKMNVIIKIPPQNAARREQFSSGPIFLREILFYNEVYPLVTKFQEDRGIDVMKEGFHHVPACFTTSDDDQYEALYLEDLKVSGFEMFDRLKEVTREHVNKVMESLGKFHAISFAMKDQNPELIEKYKPMKEIFKEFDEASKGALDGYFLNIRNQATDTIKDYPNEKLRNHVMQSLDGKFLDILYQLVDGNNAEPYSVICHGDCWNNNIMYRYENGIPVDVRLLDWQLMRYASPVCDLMYYIFGCTTKALRDKYYIEFLNVYYASLSSFLKRLGSDPSKMFPRKALFEQLDKFGQFGMLMAIMVLPVFTSNSDDIPDMDQMAENMKQAVDKGEEIDVNLFNFTSDKTKNAYKERMVGVFEDVLDLGYV